MAPTIQAGRRHCALDIAIGAPALLHSLTLLTSAVRAGTALLMAALTIGLGLAGPATMADAATPARADTTE